MRPDSGPEFGLDGGAKQFERDDAARRQPLPKKRPVDRLRHDLLTQDAAHLHHERLELGIPQFGRQRGHDVVQTNFFRTAHR